MSNRFTPLAPVAPVAPLQDHRLTDLQDLLEKRRATLQRYLARRECPVVRW